MNPINSYTSWQPLEEVIVGRAYTPDYFDFIENAQVRNQLQQICPKQKKTRPTCKRPLRLMVLEFVEDQNLPNKA
jgi:hypothetical protein